MYHVPFAFNVYIMAVMKKLKMGIEWRLPGLLYADDLVLCGEMEEDLRMMMGWFVEVCRRRGLTANAGKSKVMLMNGEDGLECEVYVDEIRFKHLRI